MISFPILNQSHVIIDCGTKKVKAKMLPVSEIAKLDEFRELAVKGVKEQSTEILAECKQKMINLAYTVVPEEVEILRLTVEQLFELLAYLMYGEEQEKEDNGGNTEEEKKSEI